MRKVKNFSLTNLRTEENFGFQMDVKALAENLPTTGDLDAEGLPEASVAILTEAVNGHTAAVTALDDALKDSASVPSSALAAEAEQGRDGSWRGLNNYVKAMTAYPEGTVAAEALAAKALIDKYGDPTDKPQTEESGILHNLIQDLENGKEESFPNLQLDVWLTDLKNKNQRFLDFSKMRGCPPGGYRERKDLVGKRGLSQTDRHGQCDGLAQWRSQVRFVYRPDEYPDRPAKNGIEGTCDQQCQEGR